MTYNLSILCVHGSIYGLISSDPNELLCFLTDYDHEGSTIHLTEHAVPGEMDFVQIDDPHEIYDILHNAVQIAGA